MTPRNAEGLRRRIEDLFAAVAAGKRIEDILRADEEAAGRVVVRPGDVSWLLREDWIDSVVVSRELTEVRLIAMVAQRPGQGALRRTLAGIKRAGLSPVIVEPTREMRATLMRWGWRQTIVGDELACEVQWRPELLEAAP